MDVLALLSRLDLQSIHFTDSPSLCQTVYVSKWAALKIMSNGPGQNGLARRGFFMLVSAGSNGVVMSTAVVASTSTGLTPVISKSENTTDHARNPFFPGTVPTRTKTTLFITDPF